MGWRLHNFEYQKVGCFPYALLDNFCCFVHAYEPRSTFESVCWILVNLFYYPMMKFKSHFCIIVDTHYSNNCYMALRTSSVPQMTTDSLGSLELRSFSKFPCHSKRYQSSGGARPEISGKVPDTSVDDDEGECNNTATEGESTNKDLSTQNAISIFFREDTIPAEKTTCGTWKSCLIPNALIPVPQLVVVFCCIILPSSKFLLQNRMSRSQSNIYLGRH